MENKQQTPTATGKFLFGDTPVVPLRTAVNKCATRGCHDAKMAPGDFCARCFVNRRPLSKVTCDNLTAFTGE